MRKNPSRNALLARKQLSARAVCCQSLDIIASQQRGGPAAANWHLNRSENFYFHRKVRGFNQMTAGFQTTTFVILYFWNVVDMWWEVSSVSSRHYKNTTWWGIIHNLYSLPSSPTQMFPSVFICKPSIFIYKPSVCICKPSVCTCTPSIQ